MRIILLILAAMGIAAVGLFVFIGFGLVHVSSLDALGPPPAAAPATEPASPSDSSSDAGASDDSESSPTTAPAPPDDRSVTLDAFAATLSGPKISVLQMSSDGTRVLKTSAGPVGAPEQPPPPPPPLADKHERHHWESRHAHRASPPYISRWTSSSDSASWDFTLPAPARYVVTFLYGGPTQQSNGDASFILTAGDARLPIHLAASAGWRAFQMVEVGALDLPAGRIHLTLRPADSFTSKQSIELRSVRLYPAP